MISKTPLIALMKTLPTSDTYELQNSEYLPNLPISGVTFIPSVESYQKIARLIGETVEHIVSTTYFGNTAQSKNSVTTLKDISQNQCLNLYRLSKEPKELILNRLSDWLTDNRKEKKHLIELLLKNKLIKDDGDNKLRGLKMEYYQILAHCPEFIPCIAELDEFKHLDAIRYGYLLNGEMVELITILKDDCIAYHNRRDPFIHAKATGFDGDIVLPKNIRTSKQRLTIEDLEQRMALAKTA